MLCINCGHDNADSAETCANCHISVATQKGQMEQIIERLSMFMTEEPRTRPKVEGYLPAEIGSVSSDHARTPFVRPVVEQGEDLLQGRGSIQEFKKALDRLSRRISTASSTYPEARTLLQREKASVAIQLQELLDGAIGKYQDAFAQAYRYVESSSLDDLRSALEAIQGADDSLFSIHKMIGENIKTLEKEGSST